MGSGGEAAALVGGTGSTATGAEAASVALRSGRAGEGEGAGSAAVSGRELGRSGGAVTLAGVRAGGCVVVRGAAGAVALAGVCAGSWAGSAAFEGEGCGVRTGVPVFGVPPGVGAASGPDRSADHTAGLEGLTGAGRVAGRTDCGAWVGAAAVRAGVLAGEDGAASGVGCTAAVPVLREVTLPGAREVAGRGGVAAVRLGVSGARVASPERAEVCAGGVWAMGVPPAGAGAVVSGSTGLAGVWGGVAALPGAGPTGAEDSPETLAAAGRVLDPLRAGVCAVAVAAADSCGVTGTTGRAGIGPAGTCTTSGSGISGATVDGAGVTLSRRLAGAAVESDGEAPPRASPSTSA